MAQDKNAGQTVLYRNRRSFAKIPDVMDVPNLIAIQTDSFKWFMSEGLDQAFQDIAPIENNTKDMCVEFGDHRFGDPKYTPGERTSWDTTTRSVPLMMKVPRLVMSGKSPMNTSCSLISPVSRLM